MGSGRRARRQTDRATAMTVTNHVIDRWPAFRRHSGLIAETFTRRWRVCEEYECFHRFVRYTSFVRVATSKRRADGGTRTEDTNGAGGPGPRGMPQPACGASRHGD